MITKERLIAAWESPRSNAEICKELRISQWTLYMEGRKYNLRPRFLYIDKTGEKTADPDEDEIKRLCAVIRSEWPEGEEDKRRVGQADGRWTMPRFVFDRRGFVLREA